MKKILVLFLSFLMVFSLSACQQDEEPLVLEENNFITSPFADANTTKRYFITNDASLMGGVVYGDNYYYCSTYVTIVAVPLSEAIKHNVMEKGYVVPVEKFTPLCPDPLCKHNTLDCPTMMRSPDARFLIEATESNGDLPVIYYFRATSETWEGDGSMTVLGSEIIRFDVAEGQAKQVVFSKEPIEQMMAFGDYLYYLTMASDETMSINTIKKTGGDAMYLPTGSAAVNLIGANDQGAYFNDDKGNVYALSLNGESFKKVFTASEYYVLGHPGRGAAQLNMFVEGDYLYYFADYETVELPYYNRTEKFNKHSIRRVRLDSPSEEGEMVAESVYDTEVYGVYNGVLYYGPFDVRTDLEENSSSDWSHSNGTINAVNLETLETHTVISDCGFNFTVPPYYINDRCIIGPVFPYREIGGYSVNGYWSNMLLDFETGAIYPVEVKSSLLRPED